MDEILEHANEMLRERVKQLVEENDALGEENDNLIEERDQLKGEVEWFKAVYKSHGIALRNMGHECMQMGGMSYKEINRKW
jgi:uncharacterized protein (DUF3084 family)